MPKTITKNNLNNELDKKIFIFFSFEQQGNLIYKSTSPFNNCVVNAHIIYKTRHMVTMYSLSDRASS